MASPPPTTPAVFLSYAREDAGAARRIADALRGFGVEVWFDQEELRGGDAWDTKIRQQIRECALFLAVISATTQAREEGYFRREWKLAVERTHDMAASRAFLLPVVIDPTPESAAEVPEEFLRVQWTRLPGAEPTAEFVAQVKRLLAASGGGKRQMPEAGDRRPDDKGQGAEGGRRTRTGGGKLLVAIAAVVIVGGAYLAVRPNAVIPAPPISSSDLKSSATKPPSDLAAPKSIAVLAFADLSEARNSEYFSDGISEELLNVLAKVPGLRVAARTSAFFYKGRNLPISEIAAKLNVAYVVEGSVQRAGERVKITAQLIKAADGFHVWSDTFTREAKDVFAVQEEIAGRIARELSLKLGVASAATTAAVNPEAFDLYVQGRQAWNLRTPEGFARAEELLNQALRLEPSFARAHAALGDVRQALASRAQKIGLFAQRNSPEAAAIRSEIDRALALDPNLAEAHTSLGGFLWQSWQVEEAVREYRLAITLNPNYATAHQWLGRALLNDGRLDEAEAVMRRATELDPLSHIIWDNYHLPLAYMHRYEDSLVAAERALALQPNSLQALLWKAISLSGLGRHVEAAALVRQTPWPRSSYEPFAAGVFFRAGAKAEAEQALTLLASGENSVFEFMGLAEVGRAGEALAAMDPALMHTQRWADVLFNAAYDPIRGDPRFVKLLATLGMTEAHARAQAWRAAHPSLSGSTKK